MHRLLRENRDAILRIARKHGVDSIRVFGSFARDEAGSESDVDLLIDVHGATPPWFPGGLVSELEALLGRRVDVVEAEALAPEMRSRILAEAATL